MVRRPPGSTLDRSSAASDVYKRQRLYVVLKDQANVAAAVVIDDPVERRTVVYELLTQHADSTQIELRRALDRWGVDYTPYYLVNSLEVDGGPLWRWWLERRPEVERVLISPELRPLPATPPMAVGSANPPGVALWAQGLALLHISDPTRPY